MRVLWKEKKFEEMEQLLANEPDLQNWWGVVVAWEFEQRGRLAKAERIHRKAAELRGDPFSWGAWRLQLKLAGESEAARARLREELERWQKADLAPRYRRQVARAYRDQLDDPETAQAIEVAVERDHPEPEEGYSFESGMAQRILGGEMDEPERMLAGGRQARLHSRLMGTSANEDASQKMARIDTLLQERPQPSLRRLIHHYLLEAQIEAKDWPGARATLAEIVASKPENIESRFKLALALADNKVDLDQALRLVEEAQALRREFRPWVRSKQFRVREWEKRYEPDDQRQAYNHTLATLADARGWMLAEQGKLEEAEQALRTAVGLNSSQQARYRLGVVLDRRGKREEALDLLVTAAAQDGSLAKAAREAVVGIFEKQPAAGADALIGRARGVRVEEKGQELAKKFIQEPAKDFELVALDGQSYRLSALRGKVVLIDFWATWCAPCVAEMPVLARLYEKHRQAGFEILAISRDTDKSKVSEFVSKHKLLFPVLLGTKIGRLYGVNGIPDNIFIDRSGNIRYRKSGFRTGFDETVLEAVVEELLASPPPPTGSEPLAGSTPAVSPGAVQDTAQEGKVQEGPAPDEEKKGDKEKEGEKEKKEEPKIKPYEEVITEEAVSDEGVFTVHRLKEKVFYEIPPSELGQDFLWVSQIAKNAPGVGYGGTSVGNRVVRWERKGDRVLLRSVLYSVVAGKDKRIARAVEAANHNTILMAFDIKALGEGEAPVIDVTGLFTKEVPEFSARQSLGASGFDAKRSFLERVVSFPRNIEVEATHTFTRPPDPPQGGARRRRGMRPGSATVLMH